MNSNNYGVDFTQFTNERLKSDFRNKNGRRVKQFYANRASILNQGLAKLSAAVVGARTTNNNKLNDTVKKYKEELKKFQDAANKLNNKYGKNLESVRKTYMVNKKKNTNFFKARPDKIANYDESFIARAQKNRVLKYLQAKKILNKNDVTKLAIGDEETYLQLFENINNSNISYLDKQFATEELQKFQQNFERKKQAKQNYNKFVETTYTKFQSMVNKAKQLRDNPDLDKNSKNALKKQVVDAKLKTSLNGLYPPNKLNTTRQEEFLHTLYNETLHGFTIKSPKKKLIAQGLQTSQKYIEERNKLRQQLTTNLPKQIQELKNRLGSVPKTTTGNVATPMVINLGSGSSNITENIDMNWDPSNPNALKNSLQIQGFTNTEVNTVMRNVSQSGAGKFRIRRAKKKTNQPRSTGLDIQTPIRKRKPVKSKVLENGLLKKINMNHKRDRLSQLMPFNSKFKIGNGNGREYIYKNESSLSNITNKTTKVLVSKKLALQPGLYGPYESYFWNNNMNNGNGDWSSNAPPTVTPENGKPNERSAFQK